MPLEASVPEELREAPLGTEHLAACMALDQACFAGLWSETHWLRELEDPRRPGVGVFHGEELYRSVGLWTHGCAFPLSPRPA